MEERTAFFQSEVTVDAAYLRRTWSKQHARGGYTSLGIFVLAVILLLFAVALPRLVVGQMLGDYRKYRSDGLRRVTLLDDGVETTLVKYDSTVFNTYSEFQRVEEDDKGWYLIRPDRRLIIPKGTTLQGDPAKVRAFLEERLAVCREALEGDEEPPEEE